MARDELAGWIGSFDRYAGGKGGADESHWLSMHNGECLIVDRKTGQPRTIYVPSAAVSVTGGVQPGILHRALGAEHRESGLLARLLLALPPRRPKRWTEAEISATAEAAVRAIFDRLFELRPDYEGDGDPRPRTISLTPEGKRAWITFYNEHAREHADLTGDLSAAWSKLEGYAARLALIVHLTRWAADDPTLADADHVDETSIRAGVALSRWFGHEARRLYDILAEPDDERERRRLLELIQRKGGSATARDLMRSSRKFKTAADAEAALEELVKMSMGSWRQAPSGPKGGKPSKIFVLTDTNRLDDTFSTNPVDGADVDDTSAGDPEDEGIVNVNGVNATDDASDVGALDVAKTETDDDVTDDEWGEI